MKIVYVSNESSTNNQNDMMEWQPKPGIFNHNKSKPFQLFWNALDSRLTLDNWNAMPACVFIKYKSQMSVKVIPFIINLMKPTVIIACHWAIKQHSHCMC